MKKSRRMVTRLLSWLLVMTLVCTGVPISVGAAKKPKLNKKSVKLKVGKTVKLKVKNNKKKVKWSSANKKIATVNKNGLVKAKKKGKTRIIAKIKKKKLICKVTVQAKNTGNSNGSDDSNGSAEENGSDNSNNNSDIGLGNETQVTQTPSDETAKPDKTPGKTPSVQKTAAPGNTSEPKPEPQNTPKPAVSPGEITWWTPEPAATTTPGETTPLPWGTSGPGETTAPGENTPLPWGTSGPGTTTSPWDTPTQGPQVTQNPWDTPTQGPQVTQNPWVTATPVVNPTQGPAKTSTPVPTKAPTAAPTTKPTATPTKVPTAKPTQAPTTKPTQVPTTKPTQVPTTKPTATPATPTPSPGSSNPGQNVQLPSGATVFTMGTKKLAIGMSRSDVNTVLGGNSASQKIRTGKAPQGFDTIAYNTSDYSEYLLIYLQGDKVVGICGIGKSMSYGDVIAKNNISSLSSSWSNLTAYKTMKTGGTVTAKQYKLSSSEQSYVFFDALGDSSIYCIQVFDPNKVTINSTTDNDMIYKTSRLSSASYDSEVTTSIAEEIVHMFNAFRVFKEEKAFGSNSGLTQCAQNYCNNATSSDLIGRSDSWIDDYTPRPGSIMAAFGEYNVNPYCYYGEACYTGAADAISFANSLIEMDGFYQILVNTKEIKYDDGDTDVPTWGVAGVGMACNGSHTYVTVDYVDKISPY